MQLSVFPMRGLPVIVVSLALLTAPGCDRPAGEATSQEAGPASTKPGTSAEPETSAEPKKWGELPDRESPAPERGVFMRRKGDYRTNFIPWESESALNDIFMVMKRWKKGVDLFFAPGTYPIEQGLYIENVIDLTISGTDGVVLEFAPGPEVNPRLTRALQPGDTTIMVDRPQDMVPGWHYQIYLPVLRDDRLLEFTVDRVEGDVVHVTKPVVFMSHVTEIPNGSNVFIEVNIFKIRNCPGLVIQNLTMDGHGRGVVRGHTTYCGLYIIGDYLKGRRPKTLGLTVRGNTFRGFQGRGLAYYNIGEALIENNSFYDIRAQAIEVDHYATGHVLNNYVDHAETGITLNDTFDVVVEGNVLRNCFVAGVYFMKTFEEPTWANTTNLVQDNTIIGCEKGVAFREPMVGNTVRGNWITSLPHPNFEFWQPEGNSVTPRKPPE